MAERENQTLARPKLVQDLVKTLQYLPGFRISSAKRDLGQVIRCEEGEPAACSPAAELPLQDSDRERNDEAPQRLGLAEGLHSGEQPIENLLSDVLGFFLASEGAPGHVEDKRSESVPSRSMCPGLASDEGPRQSSIIYI